MKCLSSKFVLMAATTVIALMVATPATRAQTYLPAVDLGVYNTPQYNNGKNSGAYGISENGYITGIASLRVIYSPYAPYDYRNTAFLWKPNAPNGTVGTMINCKNLRPEVGTGDQSVGRSVNNSGVVVGSNVTAHKAIAEFTVNADPWSIANAFVWTPNSSVTDGTIRNLGNFQSSEVGGGLGSGAWAVTNSNRIFGNSWLQGRMPDNSTYYATMGFSHSLSSSSTISLTDGVGVVAGARDSLLFDANQVGQAVGSSSTSPTSVLLYSNGGLTNLGSFGGIYAKGIGINDQGMIVGSRTIVVPSQLDTEVGFVWQPSVSNGTTGSYVDLGPITDSANRKWNVVPTAISSSPSPTVVGYMWYRDANGGSYEEKAFLWRQSTGIALLDNVQSDSTWKLRRANDVNSVGQIVGYGEHTFTNAQGVTVAYTRAFLLQPSTP